MSNDSIEDPIGCIGGHAWLQLDENRANWGLWALNFNALHDQIIQQDARSEVNNIVG